MGIGASQRVLPTKCELELGSDLDDTGHEEASFEFRHNLRPGTPAHIDGLVSQPELNGCAGLLKKWFPQKERWQVLFLAEAPPVAPSDFWSSDDRCLR